MNKKIFSAIVSIAMTATMFPMTVFAEDEVSKGDTFEGDVSVTLEGIVDKDVFSVLLPTSDNNELKKFDFIIDPQKLITATGDSTAIPDSTGNFTSGDSIVTHPKYGTAEFAQGKTMYFKSFSNDTDPSEYTDTSASIKIENKSSIGIDANVDFVISGVDGVTFVGAADKSFSGDTSTSMYLAVNTTKYTWDDSTSAIVAGTPTVNDFVTNDGGVTSAKATVELTRKNDTVYKYQYTAGTDGANGVYSYVKDDTKIKGSDGVVGGGDDYEFEYFEISLTGAVNPAGNWFALTEGDAAGFTPKIDVVFDIALDGYENGGANTGTGSTSSSRLSTNSISSAGVVGITSGTVSKVELTKLSDGQNFDATGYSQYVVITATDVTVTSKGFTSASKMIITFDDGYSETVVFGN